MSLDLMAFFQEIKDGAYVINIDDKNSKGIHWVSLFIDKKTAVYFDSFRMESILLEVLNKIRDTSITYSLFRVQDNESIVCGFYCIAFIEYMLPGKTLLDYTNLLCWYYEFTCWYYDFCSRNRRLCNNCRN